MNKDVLFSSASDEWETPIEFYEKLNKCYGFTLDPCATTQNHKCEKYYTKDQNGLAQSWDGERVFVNPPYGRKIEDWVQKAYETNRDTGTLVVMLLPARTDTRWFHEFIKGKAYITFVRGRLKFGGCKNSAPFPSMIVIYGAITTTERGKTNND